MPGKVFALLAVLTGALCALALAVALDATAFHLLAPREDTDHAIPLAVAAVALGGTALASFGLGAAALAARLRRERALLARLRALPVARVAGGDVLVVPGAPIRAFCAGLVRPRVCVSAGALERLDPRELAAVVAHERHHAGRRDPLRLAAVEVAARALFFVPGLRALAGRCALAAELSADAAAERAQGAPSLAAALLRFAEDPATGVAEGRVDRVLGEPVSVGVGLRGVAPALAAATMLSALTAAVSATTGCVELDLGEVGARPWFVPLALVPLGLAAAALTLGLRVAPTIRHGDL